MRIAMGSDHAGFPLKEDLKAFLGEQGHEVVDCGTDSTEPVDYPAFCAAAATMVADGRADRGIVVGGSGQGEQIAANKVHGVRAALCHDLFLAQLSREHNDANVLSMGARVIAPAYAREIDPGMAGHRVPGWTAHPETGADRRDRARGATEMTNKEYAADWEALKATDPEVAEALVNELERERTNLRLIASENYASPAVLAALGSTMTDKYAEGYPGRRYYGGCEFVDVTERLAIDRAKALFGADHANVQPHSGASANLAVFGAFLEPHSDDKVLGMVLAHGGHLTHGSPVNVSGKWFNFVGYEVDRETEQLDMDRIRDLAKAERPKIILSGYTAYPRTIDFAAFREIADEVGALLWVDASHFIGLVAGGAYPSPVPYADVVTFTTHKALRGPRGAMIVCKEEHAKAIDKAVFPMMQGGPLEHCIAAKAVALKEASTPEFKAYADRTVRDARALAAGLTDEGLRIVSGGTDSHLILADTRPLDIDGKTAEAVADEVGIALNKNQIPYDPNPPSTPSGIRVGTPGPSTLGMDEPEMREIAEHPGRRS